MKDFSLTFHRDLRTRKVIARVEHQPKVVNWEFPSVTGSGYTAVEALRSLADAIEANDNPCFDVLRGSAQ